MPAIANGGSQNTPEPLSCKGFGGIVEENRVWIMGHTGSCDFSATFCRRKSPILFAFGFGVFSPWRARVQKGRG